MMKVIGITGGTGFIGKNLLRLLQSNGNEVIIFTRHPERKKPGPHIRYAHWDPRHNKIDLSALKQLDAVVHLAGAGIADKRWTKKRKKEIADSRIKATNFLVSQLRNYAPRCKALIAASAIGYYGPDKKGHIFSETDTPHNDFLAKVCIGWEKASMSANDFLRVVILRNGIVLGNNGGAFPKFVKPTSFCVLPILGSGRQVVSWIHIADHIRLVETALQDETFNGIYNAVSPNPVSYKNLMLAIAHKRKGFRIRFRVPALLLKTALGEVSKEVTKSITASCDKLQHKGFSFQYPTITKAVEDLMPQ